MIWLIDHCYNPPTNYAAPLIRLIGLFPSVKIYPDNPKPLSNSAYNSGPALAIATKVS